MVNLKRAICSSCRKVFAEEVLKESLCSDCFIYREYVKMLGREPVRKSKAVACQNPGKKDRAREKIKRSNERWLASKKKRGVYLSHQEMNRRAEIARVFGKGSWDHYEKGRKWDRI